MKQVVNEEQQQLYYGSGQTSLYWWLQQKENWSERNKTDYNERTKFS